jgi:hypothetical protein
LFVVEERTPPVTYSERRNDLRLPLAVLAEARNDHLLLTSGRTQRLRFDRCDAG